ncbi:hypothetical protein IWW40_000852 [Coemansia sp. RSA 1250]|nr:hypothetical protein IWW40_000852 [Coemansia sp. RSA 1250]
MEIERRDTLSANDFVREFLEPNVPVLLGPSFTQSWPARADWVVDGGPNFARLQQLYGEEQVQVAECDKVYFSDQKRTDMRFGDFIDQWHRHPERKLYCKDWHFTRSSTEYTAYTPLPQLSDDWINIYYDSGIPEQHDDYRFCYLGGHGTWTPFHEDVYRSYSWSANICGKKRWILVPPGQNHLFTDSVGNWVYNLNQYDKAQFPQLHKLRRIEFIQREGETVFVPSGWWHQVENIGNTISINHNWANEFNLRFLYERLASDMEAVQYALRDVCDMDGFEEHAQLVLRADSGIDYRGFFSFVNYMAQLYLTQVAGECQELGRLDGYFRTQSSVYRALQMVDHVLELLAHDKVASMIKDRVDQLRRRISHAVTRHKQL